MSTSKYKLDETMTGSSIVFADDDDDDDVIKPDVRRGILRNPTKNHNIVERPNHLPTSPSPPNEPRRPAVPSPMMPGRDSIFWPVLETAKIPDCYLDADRPTGSESQEAYETGSNNAAMRKKHTVRFSPEADNACATGSTGFVGHVQGHLDPVQSKHEPRRVNIGRIAENKFNDGRNLGDMITSDVTSSTAKADSSRTGRKWYHFSFRSSKNRDKNGAETERQSARQPVYANLRPAHDEVELRCRGRREMSQAASYEVKDLDNASAKTLAAQGYRLMPSSASEPEQLSGLRHREEWNQRVLSTASSSDLRRSPTVLHDDGRKSRVTAAVRRSRSTVGDERRHQVMASSHTAELTGFSARRGSADTELCTPSTTTKDRAAFSQPIGSDQQTERGWYYGFDAIANQQQPLATSHDVTHRVGQYEHTNLSNAVESRHDPMKKSETGFRDVVTTGGGVVWSGQPRTAPRKLPMSPTPVGRERDASNDEAVRHEKNSVESFDVASNYIVRRRESFLPLSRPAKTQNWTLEKHGNVGQRLPEIRVTPATEERSRRRLSNLQLSPATKNQNQPRLRDYSAIYAWSPELPSSTVTMTRSATFGDEWNPLRSDANGYIDPARRRSSSRLDMTADRDAWTDGTNLDGGRRLVTGMNCSYCSDFVDMRGVCRAVVSAADLLQIELFYRSNKTEVISCACAARLYFASVRRHSSIPPGSGAAVTEPPKFPDAVRWYPTTAVGVPVIVLDCGGSRCRDRKLNLVLAEVGSGFALWRDTVDHLTCYRAVTRHFHSLRFSRDHSRLAGLRFSDAEAADIFVRQLGTITSGPAGDSLLNLSADKRTTQLRDADFRSSYYAFYNSTSDQKPEANAAKLRLKKCDISGPCCFEHVTKFESVPGFLV